MRYHLIALAFLLLAGCQTNEPSSSSISVRDSAGVQIVENPADDVALDWQSEEAFAIGRTKADTILFEELAPYQVGADSDGHLFVLNRSEHQVAVFDTTGALVRTLGRQGQGPGELSSPTALHVRPSGVVGIFDHGREALVRWNAEGEVLDQRNVPSEFWGPDIFAREGQLVFPQLAAPQKGTSEQELVVHRSGGDQQQLVHLSQPPQNTADFPSCGYGGVPISPLFAPELVWDAVGEVVVANAGPGYVIDRFEEGKHVQKIRRDISPRDATRDLALKEAGDGLLLEVPKRCRVPPEEVVDGRGYADLVPTIEQITLAPTGQLWVKRYAIGNEPAKINLFGPEGKYLGTLPGEFPFPAAFLTPNLIVSVKKGDVPHLAAYRVRR